MLNSQYLRILTLMTSFFIPQFTNTALLNPLQKDNLSYISQLEEELQLTLTTHQDDDIAYAIRNSMIQYIWKTTYIHHALPYRTQQSFNKSFKKYLSKLDDKHLSILGFATKEIRANIADKIQKNSFYKKPANIGVQEFYRNQLQKHFNNHQLNPYIVTCQQILKRRLCSLQQKTRH